MPRAGDIVQMVSFLSGIYVWKLIFFLSLSLRLNRDEFSFIRCFFRLRIWFNFKVTAEMLWLVELWPPDPTVPYYAWKIHFRENDKCYGNPHFWSLQFVWSNVTTWIDSFPWHPMANSQMAYLFTLLNVTSSNSQWNFQTWFQRDTFNRFLTMQNLLILAARLELTMRRPQDWRCERCKTESNYLGGFFLIKFYISILATLYIWNWQRKREREKEEWPA